MATRRVKRVRGLSKDIVERLGRNHILSCKDLLSRTELELLKLLGVGYFTVQDVILKCSEACVPQHVTSLELLQKRKTKNCCYFPTTLPDLDKVLHGGIPAGTITEIAGPSGCGKTQFCMMLSVQATLPLMLGGMQGSVLYIDTESAFSAERLVEIAQTKYPEYYNNDEKIEEISGKVLVDVQQTCVSLIQRLKSLEEDIISHDIKLVIVDSIASLVRKEYRSNLGHSLAERTNFLSQQAAILKYVAEFFSIPVIVTNQITTRYDPQSSSSNFEEIQNYHGDGGYVTAALGNTWSHNINTRLILQYLDGHTRQVMTAKSPVSPFTIFNFTIQKSGIVQGDEGAEHYEGTDPGTQHIRVRSSIIPQSGERSSVKPH